MTVVRPRSERDVQSIVFSGEPITLAGWLTVSWFFPREFGLRRIVEQNDALVAVGAEEFYRFIKPMISRVSSPKASISIAQRWRYACQEIIDNAPLAPGLYKCIRTLKWVDDEPMWLEDHPIGSCSPDNPPEEADEVCVVMRRLLATGRIKRSLLVERGNAEGCLEPIAELLQNFHSEQRTRATNEFLLDPEVFLYPDKQRFLHNLHALKKVGFGLLGAVSHLALEELSAFSKSFVKNNSDSFYSRGENGYFVNCHGNVTVNDIYVPQEHSFDERITAQKQIGPRQIYIVNRAPHGAETRKGDALNDVVSLVLDLEVRGCSDLAREFERVYFAIENVDLPEGLYKFYLVSNAIRLALRALYTATDASINRELHLAESYLSVAYKLVLGLETSFVIGIGGVEHPDKKSLVGDIARLVSGKHFEMGEVFVSSEIESSNLSSSFATSVNECLSRGVGVVFDLGSWTRSSRLNAVKLADKYKCPCLLVKCELGRPEAVHWGLVHHQDNISQVIDEFTSFKPQASVAIDEDIVGRKLNYMVVEPSLALPQLALDVLRELVRVK